MTNKPSSSTSSASPNPDSSDSTQNNQVTKKARAARSVKLETTPDASAPLARREPPPPNPNPSPRVVAGKRPRSGLKGLGVRQRLLLVNVTMFVPLIITTALFLREYVNDVNLANKQARATAPFEQLQALQRTMRSMRRYRLNNMPKEYPQELRKLSDELVSSVTTSGIKEAIEPTNSIKKEVTALVEAIDRKSMNYREISLRSTKVMLGDFINVFDILSREGQISYSKDRVAYGLGEMSSSILPRLLPEIGSHISELAVIVVPLETGDVLKPEDSKEIEVLLRKSRNSILSLDQQFNRLIVEDGIKNELRPLYDKSISESNKILEIIEVGTIKTGKATPALDTLLKQSDGYLNAQYQAFGATVRALQNRYKSQYNRALINLISLLIVVVLLAILTLFIVIRMGRSITDPLDELTQASERLAKGDLNVRVPVTGDDEISALAKAFNMAALTIQTNEDHVRAERDDSQKLQSNIGEFLDVTLDIADGDLTKRGKVTEDILGNVVDSINLMADELSHLLLEVQQASKSVDNGSIAMLGTTSKIADSSQKTNQQAKQVNEQAQGIIKQIQSMAALARDSADTANRALDSANEGQNAVRSTLENMQNLRDSSHAVSERVLSLSRRSEEIQEIVDYISQITGQVNLLSLHASIEAAGAGEAGSRFAVVAEEVRQLAELSTEATDKIADLISNVQSEIKQVTRSIQGNVAEVEKGYTVAGRAGDRLREIASLTEESAKLAANISSTTANQVEEVQEIGTGMQNITDIAEKSQAAIQSGREAAEQLRALAQQLNSSLQRFKLPETDISQS